MSPNQVLFAASEAHPFIKTGGLGDVAGSLPVALSRLGVDVRLILPGYRQALKNAGTLEPVAEFSIPGAERPVRLLQGMIPKSRVTAYFVESPRHFDRPGNPYTNVDGIEWPDNAERFALFSRAVAMLGSGEAGISWQPNLVHCNDWQTALAPALLALQPTRPATVFTVHNLAYHGLFPWSTFQSLSLPYDLWSINGMEFHGQFSFIKGGLAYADVLSTVSPTYAREILTPEFGCGLDGLLGARADRLHGILNGADYEVWDPAHDPNLAETYDANSFAKKAVNKVALQHALGLPVSQTTPLVGHIGRLVEQKGVDLLLQSLPYFINQGAQFVILGSGQKDLEDALTDTGHTFLDRVAVRIGYDEALAHLIEAGADLFVMPSRFEPCGLNQIYSLRYGTVPVVHRTGGLADTVVDVNQETLAAGSATGFVFGQPSAIALTQTLQRALALYRQPALWCQLAAAGMRQDFSWERSARQYMSLYEQARRLAPA